MPHINLIGIGVGNLDYLTKQAKKTLLKCDLILGADRLIETIRPFIKSGYPCAIRQIEEMIQDHPEAKEIGIIVSGDVGFYSLANTLRERFKGTYTMSQISGISSMQYFMNALGRPYDNLCTVSMHGRDEKLLTKLRMHKEIFVLTGGQYSVNAICQLLCDYGLDNAKVYIGERLSYEDEKITEGTPESLREKKYDSLAVMLIVHKGMENERFLAPGIPDEAFIRGKVPMTKSEIRAISLSKLQLSPDSIVYDIGAGTGSVTVEMALQALEGKVYALERKEEAAELIHKNKKHFGLHNIEVIQTECPEGMDVLPPPDAVFIGGSGGELDNILELVLAKNPEVKIVINAITLETLTESLHCFQKYGLINQDIVQVTVANSRQVGTYHMMMGQNPIFILSGQGAGYEDKAKNNDSSNR